MREEDLFLNIDGADSGRAAEPVLFTPLLVLGFLGGVVSFPKDQTEVTLGVDLLTFYAQLVFFVSQVRDHGSFFKDLAAALDLIFASQTLERAVTQIRVILSIDLSDDTHVVASPRLTGHLLRF